MDYFERVRMRGGFRWPHKLPKGRVLAHNQVAHAVDTPHGVNGFRCWTQDIDEKLIRCRCGWRGVEHYRLRGVGSGRSYGWDQIAEVPYSWRSR